MRHLICVCLLFSALSAAHGAEQDPVSAVWRTQRLTFRYHSEGRMYRCDILEHKIKQILVQLGARDRLVVRHVGCDDFAGLARLEVLMESPVIATEENVRALTRHDSEDELIARLHGAPLPSAENLERFPAAWESIALHRAPRVSLEAGDCALVQQLRRQILPKMSVQIIQDIDRADCTQDHARLTVVALVAKL